MIGLKTEEPQATAYGIAAFRADEQYTRNSANYKRPEIMAKLPPKEQLQNLNSHKLESVDVGTINNKDYYDATTNGKLRIAAGSGACSGLERTMCLRKRECGWCGASGSCIPGSTLGPQQPCLTGTFIYATPRNEISAQPEISTATNFRR